MKQVVGITGSIGSGKSTVSNIVRSLGYDVIDCDQIGHDILKKDSAGYKAVLDYFGDSILDEHKEINRPVLGHLVFDDEIKRNKLNELLHPLIKEKVKEEISKEKKNIVFMECPLLFETDFYKLCTLTMVVYVDLDNQIWRVMNRDHLDFPTALKRIYAQMPLSEKMGLADFIVDNCHEKGDLDWQVKQIVLKIERMK